MSQYRVVQVARSGRRFPASGVITALAAAKTTKAACAAERPHAEFSIDVKAGKEWEPYE